MVENVNLESVIRTTGGCGKFQLLLSVIIHSMKTVVVFSNVGMVFGSAIPDWWCLDGTSTGNITMANATSNNTMLKSCVTSSGTACTRFTFSNDIRTVVSEWDLVCSMDWIPSLTISVQMAGVFLGTIVSGHVSDAIGRKPPFFISLTILIMFNLIAALSINWIMFSVARFFIGVGVGFYLTVQYTVQVEVAPRRWRGLLTSFPSWPLEMCLLALVAYLCKEWQILHYITAGLAVPYLTSWFFIPESFRWYLAHDRQREAKKIIKRVADVNGRPGQNTEMLQRLADSEAIAEKPMTRYTALDLFRSKHIHNMTLLLAVNWNTVAMVTYAIQFGIHTLSGNLYVNMFLFGIVLSPLYFVCFYAQNRFGRRRTALACYFLTTSATLVVGMVQVVSINKDVKGKLTNAFCLAAFVSVELAWPAVQTLTLETYPTVIRNTGYGFQNMIARIGAILGPQLVFLNSKVQGILYFVCATWAACSIVCIYFIPETKDRDLLDKMAEVNQPSGDNVTSTEREETRMIEEETVL